MTALMPAVPVRAERVAGLSTLVVGAGDAGCTLVADLRRVASFGLSPVGFLDDDPTKRHRLVEGLPVLGTLADLRTVIEAARIDVVVVAIPSMATTKIEELGRQAAGHGVTVMHLPPFLASLQRQIAGTDLRSLQIGSLIGRQQLHVVSREAATMFAGRRVLVTGAGGSIGSELCRQVSALEPAELVLLDHDESNLHRLHLEIRGSAAMDDETTVVADIRDVNRVNQVFRDHRPEVVFHAAALKHLPALERHPCEGVKSNVRGTENLVRAAINYGTKQFVLVSTDKAAAPSSVLGATKRLAELILDAHQGMGTHLCSVRFGNVLGSRGALLDVLKEQFATGRPVTITHPEARRFFMTIEEAVGLVIEAAHLADEDGATYVLDMGEPVRIVDLVARFARLLNVALPEVQFTGLRPGEKLTEELFGSTEDRSPTSHAMITMARASGRSPSFFAALNELYDAASHNRPEEVRTHLAALVPEYQATTGIPAPRAHAYPADYADDY